MNSLRYRLVGVKYQGVTKEGQPGEIYSIQNKNLTQEQINTLVEQQHGPIEVENWPVSAPVNASQKRENQ